MFCREKEIVDNSIVFKKKNIIQFNIFLPTKGGMYQYVSIREESIIGSERLCQD